MLEPLVGLKPSYFHVAARYGVALGGAGRCVEAVPYLETAINFQPNHPELMIAAAQCAEARGDLGRSAQLYERAAKIAPVGELRTRALAAACCTWPST